jgi:hypothetical protein
MPIGESMLNFILGLVKGIMGLKFGWIIVIVLGLIIGGSLIRNIFTGSFSVAKFLGGFNIFAGGIQGKLIYYGILALLAFGLYYQLTRATTNYDTDYKNNIHHNQSVAVDQRVGATCIPTKILWGIIQFGCESKPITVATTNECKCDKEKK